MELKIAGFVCFLLILAIGGCGRINDVDTSALFAEAAWQEYRKNSTREWPGLRRAFLARQIVAALQLKKSDKLNADQLSEEELEALLELTSLIRASLPTSNDESKPLKIAMQKRNDGYIDLQIESDRPICRMNTEVTWVKNRKDGGR